MESFFYYFAYGSNMLKERLIARCPSSKYIGQAALEDHRLTFDKSSQDGSGKCTVVPAKGSAVEGVLWTVASAELADLDATEGAGRGYERRSIMVTRATGEQMEAESYLANSPESDLRPYDWYLALVIAGARQHHLSHEYISALFRAPFQFDNKRERPSRLQAVNALQSARFMEVLNEVKARQLRS